VSTRPYNKVGAGLWNGETGKALRRRGSDALLVANYLITSPHSNMLGLYHLPIPYMGYETALGEEGARKGLQHCIDLGFCSYDAESEMVWVHEMAKWQVGDDLKAADLRCKGAQRKYDSLPASYLLGLFFERYAAAFHMVRRRDEVPNFQQSLIDPSQAPSKPAALAATATATATAHTGPGAPSGPTAAGGACMAMKLAGVSDISPGHPKLVELLEAGITVDELADAARDAVSKGKGFAYALGTAEGRRRDAKVRPLPPRADAATQRAATTAAAKALLGFGGQETIDG
jgi:hypothetical protein